MVRRHGTKKFYHIKNLQSTKTCYLLLPTGSSFITLRIYKVLKHSNPFFVVDFCFITLRIYKVLKHNLRRFTCHPCFITLRIYKVLKPSLTKPSKARSFITLRIYKVLKPGYGNMVCILVLSH